MKILLVHNYYGSATPSGENQVFDLEKTMLSERGHEVVEFTRHSDDIREKGILGKLQGALATPWNIWMANSIKREVDSLRPDVVHVYNTFPLISPAIFYAIGNHAACVLSLSNYRLFCPAAIPMREGRVCTDCLDQNTVWPSLRYGCYRGSRLATVPLSLSVTLHRQLGTWSKKVDAFITLSKFQRDRMVEAGLPAALVHVKPNYYSGNPVPISWKKRGNYVIFAGRLTPEKGVRTLIKAWLKWGAETPELRIAGDGNLRGKLEKLSATLPNTPIRFLGQLSSEETQKQIANANLLVLPSESFETFGLVILEAFAHGTPVAVSNIGPLPSIVEKGVNGIIFEPGNSKSLLDVVHSMWNKPRLLESLGNEARRSFEKYYTERANYEMLMNIYEQAIFTNRMKSYNKI